jgi:hypothetical protein
LLLQVDERDRERDGERERERECGPGEAMSITEAEFVCLSDGDKKWGYETGGMNVFLMQ